MLHYISEIAAAKAVENRNFALENKEPNGIPGPSHHPQKLFQISSFLLHTFVTFAGRYIQAESPAKLVSRIFTRVSG